MKLPKDDETSQTQTASETEDHLITPAQRNKENISLSPEEQPSDEEGPMTIEVDTTQYEHLFKDEGKRTLGSSDEDNSANSIIMNIGSFVNSFNPLAGLRDKKRTKTDGSQSPSQSDKHDTH